jgi:hypothetical protein
MPSLGGVVLKGLCCTKGVIRPALLAVHSATGENFSPVGEQQKGTCCRRRDMRALCLGRPTLFLYSTDASLCDAGSIETLIAKCKAFGAVVEWHKWAESSMWGPDYCQRVLEFLGKVAQGQQQLPDLVFKPSINPA